MRGTHIRISLKLILSYLGIVILFTSCQENENLIGIDVLPDSDNISIAIDSIASLKTFTILDDSIRVDEDQFSSARSYGVAGSYIDPVFGLTHAGFMTQVRLSKNNVDFGTEFEIDSMILHMVHAGQFGENRQYQPQHFKVFMLSDTLSKDEDYYSNQDFSLFYDEDNLLGEKIYKPSFNDTTFSIKLDASFFKDILSDTANLTDNESFLNSFYGICVTTEVVTGGGAIVYFDLMEDLSRVTMYYHEEPSSSNIELASKLKSFDFLINDNCARINFFEHDYDNAINPINNIGDTLVENDKIYIQGLGGVKTLIKFDDLLHWKDSSGIVITRAELNLPILDNSDTYYTPPYILSLLYKTDDGNPYLPDQYQNGTFNSDYFDGYYDSATKSYKFNIALYLQDIIDNETVNTDLILGIYPKENPVMANRVILKKPDLEDGIEIKVTYVRF